MTNTTADTSTTTRTVLFHLSRVDWNWDTAQAVCLEAVRVFDQNEIVQDFSWTSRKAYLKVTFGNAAEVEPMTKAAHNAALHIASCGMEVAR